MNKRLITLALVTAQLVTWTSGALYMCVANDGSVAVDRGPASCHHCQAHEPREQASCCRAACCQEHHAAPCEGAIVLAAGSCDCEHVLISQTQSTTVTRQSAIDVERLSHAYFAALPAPASVTLAESAEDCLRMGPSNEPPAHLRALGSIILRC